MANEKDFRFSVRSGSSIPLANNLSFYELGLDYSDSEKPKLYTKTLDGIKAVAAGDAATLGGVESENFARLDGVVGDGGDVVANNGRPEGSAHFKGDVKVSGLMIGTAQTAKYADIAEYYETDKTYSPGDILMIGTDTECIIANGTMPLAGVCSTAPAYLMNTEIEELVDEDGEKLVKHFAPIALKGRIPVNISGSAKRGDYIILDPKNPGKGKAVKTYPKDPAKTLVGVCITAGKKTCEVKV